MRGGHRRDLHLNQDRTPSRDKNAYDCPHCGAFAQFESVPLLTQSKIGHVTEYMTITYQICAVCDRDVWWYHRGMVYPLNQTSHFPNPDLPDDIKADFEEAASILDRSPRGAAALLRLCIQKLCKHLGEPGENINADIKALVAKGLDERVQKLLDTVRVVGNDAVHPGKIDLNDDRELAASLFWVVNEIAEELITKPKRIDELYAKVPANLQAAIDKRDGRTT